ncbi:MAG: CoB--CoM heterodisulfide reductase iron-sulfur subunit A family protein [Candidatus Heimdallarchaeota archaeon]|nr:CoB--CoM heterodisulfide reductase iron-sulfur subunit A family protein [Candidatus Heimdallarchaeota archaeon]MCK5049223.1 CoB--CoM heterodisulfide reductase iron-sulfur subunit A family protein [Candidatus Heimdallarchaeota archaeon]
MKYNVAVIGAGIAGQQAAVDIANQGYKVVLIEKEVSIGGKMITLSKVFPTMDCCSCIATPKMSEAAKHPDIDLFTFTVVNKIEELKPGFTIKATKKAKFVIEKDCIGCNRCADVCPIDYPDEIWEHGLGVKKAIQVPFDNAMPQCAVLDPDYCTFCGACAKVCPTDCIDYTQEDEEIVLEADSIVLTTGYEHTPIENKKEYHGEEYKNVLSGLQMERLLAPHGPYGHVLRPTDGKEPWSVAYVQCAGSRDESVGVPYCSRVCCMYAVKQTMLLAGKLPLADVTVFYMDIRAFGKGYEEFYQEAKIMGINFIKAKVAKIKELPNGNLMVRYEKMEEGGGVDEMEMEMVVLSLGMMPGTEVNRMLDIDVDEYGFVETPKANIDPTVTSMEGVYVAGAASNPKDIVDAIAEASATAMKVGLYLSSLYTKGHATEAKVKEEI